MMTSGFARTRWITLELAMERRGAPANLEAAGEDALALAAALDAGLHRPPDLDDAAPDLGLGPQRALVVEHQTGDAAAVLDGVLEQLVGGVERIRHLGAVGGHAAIGRGAGVVDDEAAADRVIDPLDDRRAGGVERGEPHTVGMERQLLAAVKHQLGLGIERDGMGSEQPDALVGGDRGDARRDAVDVHRGGLVAFEPSSTALSLP